MAKFFMELCVTEYSMLRFLPSHLAAAALNLAMKAYSAGEWVSKEFNIRDNVYCLFAYLVVRYCITQVIQYMHKKTLYSALLKLLTYVAIELF